MIRSKKKQNFYPLKAISQRTLRKNKTRNLVAVLAILMTTLMFSTLFTLAQSMRENLIEMTFRQTGYDAQVSCKDITPEQAEKLAAHPDVKELGQSIVLGLAENRNLAGRQVEIRWADDSYAAHNFAAPTTGRMPQSVNDIALDTIALDRLGIPHEIGQTVTLEWSKDITDQNAQQIRTEFTLCGFWESNESSYASMAWVSQEYAKQMIDSQPIAKNGIFGLYMVQINLYSDRQIEAEMDQILADTGLDDLSYSVNLAYSPEMGATALQEVLPMYLCMVLVFMAGYLIIYNIFQISVTADVQFYGKLKTLGTTNRQIKKVIHRQARYLCMFGIPIGLVLGWLLGMVLVPTFTGTLEEGGTVSANPLIFLGSAVFAWLTVMISCLRPARLAGKVSPVEALRMNDAVTHSKKKKKSSQSGSSLVGMAWANLGRNKQRTAIVICSLTLGLVLLCCFYAKNAAFDMEKYLADLTITDFEIADVTSEDYIGGYDPKGTTLNADLISKLEAQEGVEDTGHLYSAWMDWQLDNKTAANIGSFYTEDMLADWASYDAKGAQQVIQALEDHRAGANVYGMDGIALDTISKEQYLIQGTFDAADFATGRYVLVEGPDVGTEKQQDLLPVPDVGSTVTLAGKEYTVMAAVRPVTPIFEGAVQQGAADVLTLSFILPANAFQKNWPDNTMRKLFLSVDSAHIDTMQNWLDNYTATVDASLPVTSRESMVQQYDTETRASAIMGNVISVVIALVGVLNFINSMITAIVSRKREFAMIQSIGMTKKQLCKMLMYEGLMYAAITLAASYLVSTLAVGVIIRSMVAGGFTTFRFTLLPLHLCTPIVLLFAVLLPYLCFKNLEKQSIVERLRMDV